MSPEINALEKIHRQIMWNRLIAVVEEQAQIMIRTAFSTTVREAGDLSAGIFDLQGRMMAQAVTGTPGHVNSMAESVGHFLAKFPADTMQPGDHYITNDPWLATGHLHDLTVVTPAFRGGKIVGLFANTAHVIDVGGLGMGPEGRSVYEEGMYIPRVKCFDRGQPNETFFDFMRAGSRLPVELEGDIYSLCACNDAGTRRLVQMMDEFGMESLDPLAGFAPVTFTQHERNPACRAGNFVSDRTLVMQRDVSQRWIHSVTGFRPIAIDRAVIRAPQKPDRRIHWRSAESRSFRLLTQMRWHGL